MEPDTPASLGLVPASSSGTLGTPTQPLFHYEDIVITQLSSLAQHIQTEGQVAVREGGGGLEGCLQRTSVNISLLINVFS